MWGAVPATLFPRYFAAVMATGIISVAARRLGHVEIAIALLACNVLAYPLLCLAGLVRIVQAPRHVLRELTHHETGPGFFTIAAATGVLGSQLAALGLAGWLLPWLFGAAVLAWAVVIYAFLAGVTEGRDKPPLEWGLSGTWLLMVVATQSLAVLGSDVLRGTGPSQPLALFCYACALLGGLYYVLLSAMVFYRFAFVPMTAAEVSGPWWINEGAAAITTLACAELMEVPGLHVGAFALRPLLAPVVLAFWADATFWIPLLLLLFAWKHLVRRRKLRYAPDQWSVVFPLGMYATATSWYGAVMRLPFLTPIAAAFFWIALLAWIAAAAGALHSQLTQ